MKTKSLLASLIILLGFTMNAMSYAQDTKADELQRQIDILGQEIQKLKTGPASEPVADQRNYGFGPAASKVYRSQQGVTLGGYAEVLMERFSSGFNADGSVVPGKRHAPGADFNASNGRARVDILRAVLYAGYKFDDHWVMNSEFEWEHGGAEVAVEFLYLDYFWQRNINFRFGRMLMPVGLTNELHEPTTFLSTHRPTLESLVIPTTWSEYGAGAFGDLGPFSYRSYLVTGFNGSGLDAAEGAREARNEVGFANANNWVWTTRADYTATPGLLAGGSFTIGSASTAPAPGFDLISIPMKMLELHLQYDWRAFDFRAMGAYTVYSNIDQLNAQKALGLSDSLGSKQGGFYAQVGYDLLNGSGQALIPFARWEVINTQLEVPPGYLKDRRNLIRELVVGVSYKPIPQIVFKGDYQWYLLGNDDGVNQANLSLGYVF